MIAISDGSVIVVTIAIVSVSVLPRRKFSNGSLHSNDMDYDGTCYMTVSIGSRELLKRISIGKWLPCAHKRSHRLEDRGLRKSIQHTAS